MTAPQAIRTALALALATLPFLLPAAPVVAKDSPAYTLTSFSNGNAAAMNVYRADDAVAASFAINV